jgi:hypothetical protein
MGVLAARHEITLSRRDYQIVERARSKLGGTQVDFHEAMRALREAVEEIIPAGRVFLLGQTDAGPVVGSIISGVGIADSVDGVRLVRIGRNGALSNLGRFLR